MIRNVIKNMIMKECFENLEVTSVPYDIVFADIVPINAGGKKDLAQVIKESNIDLMNNTKALTRINAWVFAYK